MVECPYCTDGMTDTGHTCGWCNGMGQRAWTCDLCKQEPATQITEMGEYLCNVCAATLDRNGEEAA